ESVIAGGLSARDAALAATEGAILARYRFEPLKSEAKNVKLESLVLAVPEADREAAQEGVDRAVVLARIGAFARDMGNSPGRHLNAVQLAEVAQRVGAETGLEVEVFDREAIMELGLGGLLGVNA